MSEENKNRNKDKGKQRNIARKYDTSPKHDAEIAEEVSFTMYKVNVINEDEKVNE